MHLTKVVEFLISVNEISTAKQLLNTFAKFSNSLDQFDELGMLFERIKDYDHSIDMLKKCSTFTLNSRQLYSINHNFSKVYNRLNEPKKSLYYSNMCTDGNNTDMLLEKSLSYYMLGNYDESQKIQLELLNRDNIPDDTKNQINYNLSAFDIKNGLFKAGIKNMIVCGKKLKLWPQSEKKYEKWDGQFTTKIILIYSEAGLGDRIMHIRFTKEIEKRNMKYVWIDNDELGLTFKNNGYNVISNDLSLTNISDYVYCNSTELVVLLNLDKADIWNGSYLTPLPTYVNKWREILPDVFITIRWGGNNDYEQELHRKIPVQQLINTIRSVLPNIPIVSLQIDQNKIDDGQTINLNLSSWNDTLAIQQLAALNITSCTSTAHSAGAIGAACIVLPPICTYYPWLDLNEDKNSYWYGTSLKVYTQTKWRDWNGPFNLLAKDLEQLIDV